jgi:hypothetical protein
MSIETERANIRAQIAADQAERADGDTHTARTVRLAAAKVSGTWSKLTAAEQRTIFGGAPFGRRGVRHLLGTGFKVRQVVSFGSDYNDQEWTYAEIAELLNAGKTVVGVKD